MKRGLLLLALLFISTSLSAKTLTNLFQKRPQFISDDLHSLLTKKTFAEDEYRIREETKDFNISEKEELFEYYKVSAFDAIEGNFSIILPKLGGGSLEQGDLGGAALLFTTGLIGWIGFGVGALAVISPLISVIPILGLVYAESDTIDKVVKFGLISGGIGLGILLVDAVIAIVRPIIYANKQNSFFKSALRIGEYSEDLSFAPIINPLEHQYGLMTSIRI